MDNDEHVYWVKKLAADLLSKQKDTQKKTAETILLKHLNKEGINMSSVNTLHLCFSPIHYNKI